MSLQVQDNNDYTIVRGPRGRILSLIGNYELVPVLGFPAGTQLWDPSQGSWYLLSGGTWTKSGFNMQDLTVNGDLTVVGETILSDRINLASIDITAADTAGGVIYGGTSSAPIIEDTASMKFISFYFDNGATSGESNGLYLRQYVTGVGGEGIAARLFQSVTNVAAGNARGGHISLSFGATGKVTGLGAALETTLHVPSGAGAWAAGTYTALKVAINSDAATSDPVGATEVSFIRVDNQGDSTGMADIDTDAVVFSLQGFTEGSGSVIRDVTDGAAVVSNGSIKIKIGSDIRYLYYYDNEAT